jgi:general secretion pathway protein B
LREIEPVRLPTPTVAPAHAAPAADLDNLPTQRELQARGISLPPLLLNLHVYDASPALRYVLLNGLRLAEGEFTPDGIKVEAITERGVVLEARGQRFLLPTGN